MTNFVAERIKKLRLYLRGQLSPLDRTALCPRFVLKDGFWTAFWWVVPSAAGVFLITRYKNYLPFPYLDAAISDGLGAHWWNVIGMFGLALFGLSILLPRCKFVAVGAYQVLANAYGAGWLACGLLLGLLITRLPGAVSTLPSWKAGVLEAMLGVMLLDIFLFNCFIWWFSSLMKSGRRKGGFLHCVEQIDWPLRLVAFIFLSILPTVVFVIRGH